MDADDKRRVLLKRLGAMASGGDMVSESVVEEARVLVFGLETPPERILPFEDGSLLLWWIDRYIAIDRDGMAVFSGWR